jgi:hypothetical protein
MLFQVHWRRKIAHLGQGLDVFDLLVRKYPELASTRPDVKS